MFPDSFLHQLFCHEPGLATHIDCFLDWQSVFAIKYTNTKINQLFHHPYVRHVLTHFQIKDGSIFSEQDAKQFLSKTRSEFGTELLETAIFENFSQLQQSQPIPLKGTVVSIDLIDYDKEIQTALRLSKWSLYYNYCDHKNDPFVGRKLDREYDLIPVSEYQYNEIIADPLHRFRDPQLQYIFAKTNLPFFYRYILARRIVRLREKCQAISDSFRLDV